MATKNPGKKSAVAAQPVKAAAAKLPQVSEVAALFGIEVTAALDSAEVYKLRKALPGYAPHLEDAAELLAQEPKLQQIIDITPQALRTTHTEQKALLAKESIAHTVYESIYYQRLQVDDHGMEMLQKLGRKLQLLAEDDPALLSRWKSLLDYLGTFRRGPGSKSKADDSKPTTGAGEGEG